MKFEQNDRQKLIIDLKARSAKMFRNDRCLGTLAPGEFPDEMYLVAGAYYEGSSSVSVSSSNDDKNIHCFVVMPIG